MKTPLLYGCIMALIGALLTFGLFFAGYHDTPEKMKALQWPTGIVGIGAAVTCMALAMRERRAEFPADRQWGYGSAFGTGVLTGLWAALFGAVLGYIYFAIVNPGFSEVTYQAQVAAMQEKGMSSAQIEGAAPMMRRFVAPVAMTVFQAIFGLIWSVILSLIIAIFFRKREQPAMTMDAPPPLA